MARLNQGRRRGRSEPGGWRAQAVPPQAFSRASAQSRAYHLPPPISDRHGQATALGPSWGRRTAVTHGQPRCPNGQPNGQLVSRLSRDQLNGPYVVCKGSEGCPWGASNLPATSPRVASRGLCALARVRLSTCGIVRRSRQRQGRAAGGEVFTRQRPQVLILLTSLRLPSAGKYSRSALTGYCLQA
jgi:hypothetical protein